SIKPAQARSLAGAAHLAGLRRLLAANNPLAVEGVAALAGSPHLARLDHLSLSGSAIGDEGLAAVTSGRLARLPRVGLVSHNLSGKGLQWLMAWPALAGVEALDLAHNAAVGDAGACLLAGCPAVANLRRLSLACCGIGPAGGHALAESPYLGNLCHLNLTANFAQDTLGPEAGRALRQRFGARVNLPPGSE